MNLSYWEIKNWLTDIDYTIVGSGIVGLNCALQLKQRFPNAKILILEKGILPQGASTKNAGFVCFGSLSEIIDDLNHHSEIEVLDLIKNRIEGLQLLRETLGDDAISYRNLGGYELFLDSVEGDDAITTIQPEGSQEESSLLENGIRFESEEMISDLTVEGKSNNEVKVIVYLKWRASQGDSDAEASFKLYSGTELVAQVTEDLGEPQNASFFGGSDS